VRERQAYAHETLDAVLKRQRLDARDTAFATRLAYGAVACRGTLDEALDRFLTDPKAVEPLVRDALVVSAYEILFTATPQRAAVSEGVELVRAVQPRAAGLANAVLRKLASGAVGFPWGDISKDNAALARQYGHPRWLAEMWIQELGREVAESVMAADNEPAPLYLANLGCVGPLAETMSILAEEGAEPHECELPECVVVSKPALALRSRVLSEHRAAVVDAGAQFAARAMRIRSGQTAVEIGAGRGGKSILLACMAAMVDTARAGDGRSTDGRGIGTRVIAVDNHAFKLEVLAKSAQEMGLSGIETLVADATQPSGIRGLPDPEEIDAVLVDAPCSGLGTLRRHPDRRWRASYADVEALGLLGEKLLLSASRLVKHGGFVVYSTCTVARRENSEVIERFLASEAGEGFSIDSLEADVPSSWKRFVDAGGTFQSLPEIGGIDGHFVARLRRD
jgi:16S rRNA (cytosine967-C5)-methyltransferase